MTQLRKYELWGNKFASWAAENEFRRLALAVQAAGGGEANLKRIMDETKDDMRARMQAAGTEQINAAARASTDEADFLWFRMELVDFHKRAETSLYIEVQSWINYGYPHVEA